MAQRITKVYPNAPSERVQMTETTERPEMANKKALTDFPKIPLTARKYDTPEFWGNYLDEVHKVIRSPERRAELSLLLFEQYECGNYEKSLEGLEALLRRQPTALRVGGLAIYSILPQRASGDG